MKSLKWRIAVSYAVLLALAIATIGVVISWRFQAILYDQARERVNRTMAQIVQAAQPAANPFVVTEQSGNRLNALISSDSLANWESPSTFVQFDDAAGATLAKTSNMGGLTFGANPAVTRKSPGPDFRTEETARGPFLIEDRYLQLDPQQAVIVHVAEPLDALMRTFAQTRQTIALILAGTIAAVLIVSLFLASQITDPLNKLARTMREMGSDRLDQRLHWTKRRDEIGQLASSFDGLLSRLSEAFARERQFISDASHELKTPLTSINANAQMLLRWGDRDDTVRRESLETIVDESGALAGMVGGMLTLAKADRGDDIPKEPVSLSAVASEAVKGAAQRAADKRLELRFESSERDGLVLGDASLLRQLVSNLVDNAIKFTESGRVSVRVDGDPQRVWVDVADTGPGIPEAELTQVFDRFYRADKARSRDVPGTGLGLAIVRSIARVHHGDVVAENAPEGGTRMRASFPHLPARFTQSS